MRATVEEKSEKPEKLICEHTEMQGDHPADFIENPNLDAIEDAVDLRDWNAAKAEYDANPVAYSNDEVMREFGLR